MPAHDGIRRDEAQVIAPAGADSASQNPEQLVPHAQASTRCGPSWPSQDGELMAQQQVLDYEVMARAHPGEDGRDQQPEEFEHALSIGDLRPARELAAPQPVAARGRRIRPRP